jgi:type IV fimbrial biogenesis protein FimT
MQRNFHSGFSLIELAIVLALIAILASLAMPAFSTFIANSRIRTAAEGMLNGLQIARAEAVRRNTFVDLQIGADNVSWTVVAYPVDPTAAPGTVPPPVVLQRRDAESNLGVTAAPPTPSDLFGATLTTAANLSVVTFGGLGRVVAMRDTAGALVPADPEAAPPARLAIRYTSSVSDTRPMCVALVSDSPRLCDPARGPGDPQGCEIMPRPAPSRGALVPGC